MNNIIIHVHSRERATKRTKELNTHTDDEPENTAKVNENTCVNADTIRLRGEKEWHWPLSVVVQCFGKVKNTHTRKNEEFFRSLNSHTTSISAYSH